MMFFLPEIFVNLCCYPFKFFTFSKESESHPIQSFPALRSLNAHYIVFFCLSLKYCWESILGKAYYNIIFSQHTIIKHHRWFSTVCLLSVLNLETCSDSFLLTILSWELLQMLLVPGIVHTKNAFCSGAICRHDHQLYLLCVAWVVADDKIHTGWSAI